MKILLNASRIFPVLILFLFVRNLLRAGSAGEIVDEYIHIVSDPAHMLAEFTFITIEVLILAPILAYIVKRHDAKHHNHTNHDNC